MILQVKARYDFGQLRFYPANDVARSLCKLTKTTTFTTTMLRHAKSMGAVLELVESNGPTIPTLDLSLFGGEK